MKLATLHVRNFRSIRELKIEFDSMGVILGPNNHGKSNILAAVDFLLSTRTNVLERDFFAFRDADDQELWVQGTFVELTPQERTTFAHYVQADGSVGVRKTASLTDEGISVRYQGVVESPDEWWLQPGAYDRLNTLAKVADEAAVVPELNTLGEGGGRMTRDRVNDFQQAYIEANRDDLEFSVKLEPGNFLGAKNVASGLLPEFQLVPAVRDVAEETKVKSTSALGRLLQRAIAEMTEGDAAFRDLQERVGHLVEELNARPDPGAEGNELANLEKALTNELNDWGVTVGIQVQPPEMSKIFELGTDLVLDDGHQTTPDLKGHGLQRALIFALIRAWAAAVRAKRDDDGGPRARAASESLIFAIEEPELFLHPHAQRILAGSLRDLAATENHQVLVCTHSTHFVNLDEYRRIVVAKKPSPDEGTGVLQCTEDLFEGEDNKSKKLRFHMAHWVNPDRSELFFARKVVLVEGETEQCSLPYVASRIGCFDHTVSVIDCGSKNNLPLYIQILEAFSIPYVVVHDEDPLPDPIPDHWSADRIRSCQSTFDLNAEIAGLVETGEVHVIRPDFEGMCGTPRNSTKGKALAALETFQEFDDDGFVPDLLKVVRAAFS